MMAKMFYTLDETKTALGKNEEDIKQLTREGRLREFRDGPVSYTHLTLPTILRV